MKRMAAAGVLEIAFQQNLTRFEPFSSFRVILVRRFFRDSVSFLENLTTKLHEITPIPSANFIIPLD